MNRDIDFFLGYATSSGWIILSKEKSSLMFYLVIYLHFNKFVQHIFRVQKKNTELCSDCPLKTSDTCFRRLLQTLKCRYIMIQRAKIIK